ncbi:hypothetical protein M0R72_02475 [Candidatus Pacearchaeota archaeon]|jgi:hypothetical protein|nr:hypothetical protein [Candidatus Pacearchaeota archaeon]
MIIVTSFVLSKRNERNKEFLFALTKNSANVLIDSIHVVTEDESVVDFVKNIGNVCVFKVDSRPTFKVLVDYANTLSGPVAIANSDIFFDDSLAIPEPGVAFCLTRWFPAVSGNGPWHVRPWIESDGMSFDAWIFHPPIIVSDINFYLGILGCDGKFAYELHRSGLKVINPSKKIRSYHVHGSVIRDYGDEWVKGSYLRIGMVDDFKYHSNLIYVTITKE